VAPEEQRGVDGDRHVQKREERVRAAGEVHQRAHYHDVEHELRAGERAQPAHPVLHSGAQDGGDERQHHGRVEAALGLRESLARVLRRDRQRPRQDRDREDEPARQQRDQPLAQRRRARRAERRVRHAAT
jgi:hypothetical protein